MNRSRFLMTLLAAPIVMSSAAHAEKAPETIAGYLPCNGTAMPGAVIRPMHDQAFLELHKAAVSRFVELPKEKKDAINKKGDADRLMAYDADLWPDKAEYEKYAAAWKKTQMVRLADVHVGLKSAGDGIYNVLSATRTANGSSMPLTIGSLRYNCKKNAWISNNGELTATPFSADETFIFGPQTGNEWKLNKKDSLSELNEMIRITKATDGKAVYLYYSLTERSSISGTVIANHGYTILFPITTASARATRPGRK